MPPRARVLTAARTGPQESSADAVWGRGLVRADSLALDERAKSAGSFGGPATPFAASASPGEARKFRRQGSEVRERRALCARTKTGAVFPPCSRAGGAPVQVGQARTRSTTERERERERGRALLGTMSITKGKQRA